MSLSPKVPFNPATVRDDFPLLNQSINGHPLAYLDNAASTQKPRVVIETMNRFYGEEYSNIHRGVHALSQQATELYDGAREVIAGFFGASDSREIVFVRGTTEGINLVAQSFVRSKATPGSCVLLTEMEHHANIVPWQILREQVGLELAICPVSDEGDVDLSEWKRLLTEKKPLLASFVHVSNALGTINPAAEMIAAAREANVPVLLDAAQSTPHFPINVAELDPDFLVMSGHKLFGPTGIGVLYGKYRHLSAMPPYQGGGDMIQKVTFEKTRFKAPPERFEAGTPHIAGAIGLAAAVRYLQSLDRNAALDYENRLRVAAEEGLAGIPGLRLIGRARSRASVVPFVLENAHPHDIGTFLDQKGIAIRSGHHCAQPLMRRLGLPGTARASFTFYNTVEEVERLVDEVTRIERFFR